MLYYVFSVSVYEELNRSVRVMCGCWQCVCVLSPVLVVIYLRRGVSHIEEVQSHPQHQLKAALQSVVHSTPLAEDLVAQQRDTQLS